MNVVCSQVLCSLMLWDLHWIYQRITVSWCFVQISAKAKTSYLYLEMTVPLTQPSIAQEWLILYVRYGPFHLFVGAFLKLGL